MSYQYKHLLTTSYEQEFTAPGTWQLYEVPPNAISIFMFVMGAGANGGMGGVGATSGGGGGGGCAGQCRYLIPAESLPSIIYVYCGMPGGGVSYVCRYPDASANVIACSGASAAQPGADGGDATNGIGGTQEPITTAAIVPFSAMGVRAFTAGGSGSAGGITTGNGTTIAQFLQRTNSGGSGGGGQNGVTFRLGGTHTGGDEISVFGGPNIAGSTGPAGIHLQYVNQFFGGCGGAAGIDVSGGDGGMGAYGCGGGGGGAAFTGQTPGNGGQGGGGYIYMVAY